MSWQPILFTISILMGLSLSAAEPEVLFPFQKSASKKHLSLILQGTLAEKIQYIQSCGIKVFKITPVLTNSSSPKIDSLTIQASTVDQEQSHSLAFLAEAPIALLNQFGAHFSNGTEGLYLSPALAGNTVTVPTILFSSKADSWTVVHEFLHFLFEESRQRGNLQASAQHHDEGLALVELQDAQEDFQNLWSQVRRNLNEVNRLKLAEAISSFVIFADRQMNFLITYQIEEMVIEQHLQKLYLSPASQTHLSQDGYNNSFSYIQRSKTKALSLMAYFNETCNDLVSVLNSTDTIAPLALKKTCAKANDIHQQLIRF